MILMEEKMDDEGINISTIIEYNEEIEIKARDKFNKLKDSGVIQNLSFDDEIWMISNKFKVIRFIFNFDEVLYKKEYKNREMLTYKEFVNSVKSFCILIVNNYIAETIADFITRLKIFMHNTHYLNLDYKEKGFILNEKLYNIKPTVPLIIKDFFNFINTSNIEIFRELILEDLEYFYEYDKNLKTNKTLNRRNLSDFQSIFLFDKLLNEFWKSEITEEEKTFYYPIYLWWNITNIIPIRVTEFLITPLNCIKKDDNGNYTISIRRSNLKGAHTKRNKVTYDIEKDYRICTYPISKKIAIAILDYKKRTKSDNRHFLISLEAYLNKKEDKIKRLIKSFLPSDLNNLLLKFYINILQNRKGLKIVNDNYLEDRIDDIANEPVLSSNEIKTLNAGDTRHFALINMVLSDFNPLLIKDFAGHTNINTSYHYFGNIAEVVKCMSYNKYQELIRFDNDNIVYQDDKITSNKILISMDEENEFTTEVDYGICLSQKFFNGNLEHCKIVAAECDVCNFFKRTIKENSEIRKSKLNQYEENIRREGALLGKLLSNSVDNIKEIGESVLKIQNNAARYMKKFNDGGYSNGE